MAVLGQPRPGVQPPSRNTPAQPRPIHHRAAAGNNPAGNNGSRPAAVGPAQRWQRQWPRRRSRRSQPRARRPTSVMRTRVTSIGRLPATMRLPLCGQSAGPIEGSGSRPDRGGRFPSAPIRHGPGLTTTHQGLVGRHDRRHSYQKTDAGSTSVEFLGHVSSNCAILRRRRIGSIRSALPQTSDVGGARRHFAFGPIATFQDLGCVCGALDEQQTC